MSPQPEKRPLSVSEQISCTVGRQIGAGRCLPDESILFGCSPRMQAIRSTLASVAASNVPVLIHGESGTGKELVAQQIHKLSVVSAGRFVKVNCPAIPGTLFESELFGYQKGAFTGANGNKVGRVALADRGTLFLD